MRLAIVSDIHANLPALEAVAADIRKRKPDMVINLGDCVSGPLWPKETLDLLRELDWPTVRGNCDRAVGSGNPDDMWPDDRFAHDRLSQSDQAWLKGLPQTIQVTNRILACHGTPGSDSEFLIDTIVQGQFCLDHMDSIRGRLADVKAPLVLYGHSHIQRITQVAGAQLAVNPGSVGMHAVDCGEEHGQRVVSESGSPHARYAIISDTSTGFDVEQLAISYHHEAAAQRAKDMGFENYVQGLRTGTLR